MTRLVIPGGAGFIGSQCAEYYAKKGYDIGIIDNFSRGQLLHQKFTNLRVNVDYLLKTYPNIQLFEYDLRDYEKIRQVFDEADGVIFTAGQTAVTTSLQSPHEDFENNVTTTLNVLECIRNAHKDIPMIYCSTNKVYGDNINRLPIIEGKEAYSFAKPFENGVPEDISIDRCIHTPYGVSKLAADLYVQEYGKIYGIHTAVFRMSCIYGRHQFGIEDQGWVTHFIVRALFNLPIKIYGDGKQVRDLLFVTDLVELFNLYLKNCMKIGSDVFNIGGGPQNAASLLQILKMLREIIKSEIKVEMFDWRSGDQKIYISNIQKAKNKLGWSPSTPIEKGVKETIQWVSSNMKLFQFLNQ